MSIITTYTITEFKKWCRLMADERRQTAGAKGQTIREKQSCLREAECYASIADDSTVIVPDRPIWWEQVALDALKPALRLAQLTPRHLSELKRREVDLHISNLGTSEQEEIRMALEPINRPRVDAK